MKYDDTERGRDRPPWPARPQRRPDRRQPISWPYVDEPKPEYPDDEPETIDELKELLGILPNVDKYQSALNTEINSLHRWVSGSPQLTDIWSRFQKAGGATADEFENFLKWSISVPSRASAPASAAGA